MRLIHFKIIDVFGTVLYEHNSLIGGIGPLTVNALALVIRKFSGEYNVPAENVIIANIMDILEPKNVESNGNDRS